MSQQVDQYIGAKRLDNISVVHSARTFKRLLLNKSPEFPLWGLYICVDFNLRNQKQNKKNVKKSHNIMFLNLKILVFTELPVYIHETEFLKLGFIAILCLKFWALRTKLL